MNKTLNLQIWSASGKSNMMDPISLEAMMRMSAFAQAVGFFLEKNHVRRKEPEALSYRRLVEAFLKFESRKKSSSDIEACFMDNEAIREFHLLAFGVRKLLELPPDTSRLKYLASIRRVRKSFYRLKELWSESSLHRINSSLVSSFEHQGTSNRNRKASL